MLNRLMGWAIFAKANRVVREDEDAAEPGECREPERAAHVVAEGEERGAERDQAAVVDDPVGDRRHRVLAHTEADVAARLVRREAATLVDVGEVRLREVSTSADQLGEHRGQSLDAGLADVARRRITAELIGGERALPAARQVVRHAALQLRRLCGEGGGVGEESLGVRRNERFAAADRTAIELGNIGWDVEGCIWICAVCRLRELHFVWTERCTVRLLAARLVRRTESDDRSHRDEARPLVRDGGADRRVDGGDVVAVGNAAGVPAVRIEAPLHILRPGGGGRSVELDQVVIPEIDQLAELQVPCERCRFRRDPFLQVTV